MPVNKLPEKVFLTGFMGAGKTSVGSVLADILNMQFHDLDSLLASRQSAGIEEIISSLGESEFRRLESELLAEICFLPGAAVVSTGGGAIIAVENRRAMERSGVVIYLKATMETLMRRISGDIPRPLLKVDDLRSKAEELFSARDRFYQTADFTIETDGLSAREVAEKAAGIFLADGVKK